MVIFDLLSGRAAPLPVGLLVSLELGDLDAHLYHLRLQLVYLLPLLNALLLDLFLHHEGRLAGEALLRVKVLLVLPDQVLFSLAEPFLSLLGLAHAA